MLTVRLAWDSRHHECTVDIVDFLLESGADIDLKHPEGNHGCPLTDGETIKRVHWNVRAGLRAAIARLEEEKGSEMVNGKFEEKGRLKLPRLLPRIHHPPHVTTWPAFELQ